MVDANGDTCAQILVYNNAGVTEWEFQAYFDGSLRSSLMTPVALTLGQWICIEYKYDTNGTPSWGVRADGHDVASGTYAGVTRKPKTLRLGIIGCTGSEATIELGVDRSAWDTDAWLGSIELYLDKIDCQPALESSNVTVGVLLPSVGDVTIESALDGPVVLIYNAVLASLDMATAVVVDGVVISQTHALTVAEAEVDSYLDLISLGFPITVEAVECLSDVENIVLSMVANKVDCLSSLDNISLGEIAILEVGEVDCLTDLPDVAITQLHFVLIGEVDCLSYLQELSLDQVHILTVDGLELDSVLDGFDVVAGELLEGLSISVDIEVDEVALFQAHAIVVDKADCVCILDRLATTAVVGPGIRAFTTIGRAYHFRANNTHLHRETKEKKYRFIVKQ
jgi:hypothetical protein